MENGQQPPAKLRKPIVVLEFSCVENFDERYVEVIASVPGREGVRMRRWKMMGNALQPGVSLDLHAWVSKSINEGLWSVNGLQDVLPL